MAEYRAFSSTAEVLGQAVLCIVGGMASNRVRALQLLAEQGVSPLEPARWYPQQAVLDVLQTIFQRIGPSTVHVIGRQTPDWAAFPPAATLEGALRSIEQAYQAHHRSGDVGHYRVESAGERSARVVCENPYPCDFDFGLVEAVAEKHRPLHSLRVRVEHVPGACRKHGAEACTYAVRW